MAGNPLPKCDHQKCLHTLPNVPWGGGGYVTPTENQRCRVRQQCTPDSPGWSQGQGPGMGGRGWRWLATLWSLLGSLLPPGDWTRCGTELTFASAAFAFGPLCGTRRAGVTAPLLRRGQRLRDSESLAHAHSPRGWKAPAPPGVGTVPCSPLGGPAH